MHEIQRPAGGFVAWKMCENTHTMDAPGCAGEASMCNIPWMSESFIVIAQFWQKICTELLRKTNGCNLTHIGQNITVVTFLTHKTKLAVFQEDYQWGLQRFYYLGRLIYPVAWVPSSGAIVSILGLGDSKRHHGCKNTNIDTRYNRDTFH